MLRHPSKLIVTSEATLFVADTGNHRVIELELARDQRSATIARVFGNGAAAFVDGPAERASFRSPRGLARRGRTLYVADSGNHAVRAVDLHGGDVRTVAGTSERIADPSGASASPTHTPLGAPCGLFVQRPRLFIAASGSHRVFSLEDETTLLAFAGDARDAFADGPALRASFRRPSDLCSDGRELFVADAGASAVRSVALVGRPTVRTLVGGNAFDGGDVDGMARDAGDVDGTGDAVRLRAPSGIAFDGLLFIADTDNHKIKRLDPTTLQAKRLAGSGAPGHVDGPGYKAQFDRPEGVAVRGRFVYVADTHNHAIRVIDMRSVQVHTLAIDERAQA